MHLLDLHRNPEGVFLPGQPAAGWSGMGVETPAKGVNFQGEWTRDKVDADGKPIPLAHKNARYTVRMDALQNADPDWDNPRGVKVDAKYATSGFFGSTAGIGRSPPPINMTGRGSVVTLCQLAPASSER